MPGSGVSWFVLKPGKLQADAPKSKTQIGINFLTFSTEENYNSGEEGCQSCGIPPQPESQTCTEHLFYFIIDLTSLNRIADGTHRLVA